MTFISRRARDESARFDAAQARPAIERLRGHGDSTAAAVATALETVVADPNGAALPWSERIEAVRRDLASSREPLTVEYNGVTPGKAGDDTGGGRTISGEVKDAARASLPFMWAVLLFQLVRRQRPERCLELGTCLGVSAAYQAAALEDNGGGRLVTIEGAPTLVEIARRALDDLGLLRAEVVTGRFQDVLEPVLEEHGPIDFAFVDGHHDEHATVSYFETIAPRLSPGALLVFDDIAWSPGMTSAWRRIAADERVGVAVDLERIGLCIVGEPTAPRLALTVGLAD